MTLSMARHIVLAARPQGKPQLTDFRLEETAIPTPSAGQVLLRVQYLSLDPVWLKISAVSTPLKLLRLSVYWTARSRYRLQPEERR